MAILPKKTGDTRTVAVAATLYRLLMQMDAELVDEYEVTNAYYRDSAKKGASALTSAEDRALMAELASLKGLSTYTLLWDISKFFDSMNVTEFLFATGDCARWLIVDVVEVAAGVWTPPMTRQHQS